MDDPSEIIIQFIRESQNKTITAKTIARHLGLKNKVVNSTLYMISKYDQKLRRIERTPLSVKKRPVWYYGDKIDFRGEDFFSNK
jgi:hypothetical protein